MSSDLHQCRVVLVRPKIAGNLGAAARIMRNLGLSRLVLVAPEADPADQNARQLSTHGEEILQQSRTVNSLGEAIGDCIFVAASSARIGGPFRRQTVAPPDEIMPRLVTSLEAGPAALVFGPEPSGLTNMEVSRCHFLIHIPSDPGYPALNLAQAVAICLYEVRRAWLKSKPASAPEYEPASIAELELMFAKLQSALEIAHYLYGPNADSLMHAVRHLIMRAHPSAMEVDLLFGLARQIDWVAKHAKQSDELP
jgi:tRNA/rRNA methyltransferase